VIWENRESFWIGRVFSLSVWRLVSVTLISSATYRSWITHTEHHRGLVDVVFESQESEAIADLLHAWTMKSGLGRHVALLGSLYRAPRWSSQRGSVLLKVAAARHTLRRGHWLQGIRGGRGGEVHWIAEPSPCHSRGYGREGQLGNTPLRYHPILRGSPAPIPLVLGVPGGACSFGVTSANT
jgi:hypothetical protein